jgi:hypothetical protein
MEFFATSLRFCYRIPVCCKDIVIMTYWSVIFIVILRDYGRPDGEGGWVGDYTFPPPLSQ